MRQQETERSAKDLIHSGLELGRRERLLAFNAAAAVSLLVHAGIVVAALDLSQLQFTIAYYFQ